jgi:hypothetical protein
MEIMKIKVIIRIKLHLDIMREFVLNNLIVKMKNIKQD